MLKNKKNIGIIILVMIIAILIIVLINKIILKNNQQLGDSLSKHEKVELNNEIKFQQTDGGLSRNEIETGMNELSTAMKNKTDKCKIIVNGEKISEKDIAYIDFIINNTITNENQEKKDAINEAIIECVIEQDARARGITLTKQESESIEERTKGQFKKDREGMNNVLNSFHMNYDEFLEFYIAKMKRLELETKWTMHISDAIKKGELYIEKEELNEKCKEYNKIEDSSQKVKLLIELVNKCKEYLKDSAKIEYVN